MTDNEIIKTLECCLGGCLSDCENCPNEKTCKEIDVIDSVIDLINRQKAEIERLEKELAKQKAILEAIDNEMFPLPFETDFNKAIKTAKSEAIKEFAERLKSEYEDEKQGRYINWLMSDIIKNLVKEMTEGEK